MASNVRIVVNPKAVEFYLKGGGKVAEVVTDKANAIATSADANTGRTGDHKVDTGIGPRRFRAAVITETFNAMHREADQRTLSRALDAGRA